MTMKFRRMTALACGLAPVVLPAAAHAQAAHQASGGESQNVEQRIDDLKAMKKEMLRMMRSYEARIQKLEAEVKARPAGPAKVAAEKSPAATESSPQQQPLVMADASS